MLLRTALLTAMILSLNTALISLRRIFFASPPGAPSMQCFVLKIYGTLARLAAMRAVMLACVCTISGLSARKIFANALNAFLSKDLSSISSIASTGTSNACTAATRRLSCGRTTCTANFSLL